VQALWACVADVRALQAAVTAGQKRARIGSTANCSGDAAGIARMRRRYAGPDRFANGYAYDPGTAAAA
jgi:hypothetical protein